MLFFRFFIMTNKSGINQIERSPPSQESEFLIAYVDGTGIEQLQCEARPHVLWGGVEMVVHAGSAVEIAGQGCKEPL